MSLTLKHSYLSQFPKIESCLVALCAYTCYFFSNGLNKSGIVSLLFCGITLKHYAYHIMSRRTQRATKYIFSILAQLSENFIFIYLGLSLFTSAPSGAKVTDYFKPLFIIISTVSVIFVRYASVFPLSEAINLFQRHIRGQRQDEIPYSYQMMLFWAGLRGAVGVALAAGFQGKNAETMRLTVLVVVVLTVVIFGGTTARMLEVLNIRTGVEDDAADSSDEEEVALIGGNGSLYGRRGSLEWERYRDEDVYPPSRSNRAAGYNHHAQSASLSGPNIFSASSSESYDSDSGEVLPLATPPGTSSGRRTSQVGGAGTEGKWFQAIDERYLLPLFSNATASRTFHARRQKRRMARPDSNGIVSASGSRERENVRGGGATPLESEDEGGREVDLRDAGSRNRSGTGSSSSRPQSPWIGIRERDQRAGSPREQNNKFGS